MVDARKGRITNVIQFTDPESKADKLRVRLTAKAVGARRLELTFRWVCVTFKKRLFGLFRSVYVPLVPATFLARSRPLRSASPGTGGRSSRNCLDFGPLARRPLPG